MTVMLGIPETANKAISDIESGFCQDAPIPTVSLDQ